jgi:hypothetical protein
VVTGVVVQTADTQYAAAIESRVRMRGYSDAEIDEYVGVGRRPRQGGAYGIQDAPFLPGRGDRGLLLQRDGPAALERLSAAARGRLQGAAPAERRARALRVCPMRP